MRVARVARERLDPVEVRKALVVERELALADAAWSSSRSSWTSAIAARTSERLALKPGVVWS